MGLTTNGLLCVGHGPPMGSTTFPFRSPFVGKSLRVYSGFDPALTRDVSGLSFLFSSQWNFVRSNPCRSPPFLVHVPTRIDPPRLPFVPHHPPFEKPDRPSPAPGTDSQLSPSFPRVCRRGPTLSFSTLSSFLSSLSSLPFGTRSSSLSTRLGPSRPTMGGDRFQSTPWRMQAMDTHAR